MTTGSANLEWSATSFTSKANSAKTTSTGSVRLDPSALSDTPNCSAKRTTSFSSSGTEIRACTGHPCGFAISQHFKSYGLYLKVLTYIIEIALMGQTLEVNGLFESHVRKLI